ncbi:MAG: ATPase [Schleiferiaceae bacterium]|nr:ATPase [Schleiferiaceae bacterium]
MISKRLGLFLTTLGILISVIELGFLEKKHFENLFQNAYVLIIAGGIISVIAQRISKKGYPRASLAVTEVGIIAFGLLCIVLFNQERLHLNLTLPMELSTLLKFSVFLLFIKELSEVRFNYNKTLLNPAQLLMGSFLIIITAGTALLSLPNATTGGISFVDALFTATSATCITGLIVQDTGTYFTTFGLSIILVLMQLGAMGILTFASYFSFFFKGGSSYENQMVIKDFTSSKKLSEVYSVLKNILIITLTIELITAFFIFLSIRAYTFPSFGDRLFFTFFHAVSAFCNAGFTTLSDSLYDQDFRFNYFFHTSIFVAFFLGSLGFPIVANSLKYFTYRAKGFFTFKKKTFVHKPWVLSINSRITLITTLIITVVAFVTYFILEYNNTLKEHEGFGKVIVALLGASTPRSSGFNAVDNGTLLFPTTMFIILLMWIGGSPASTGGGIKTSTFAIATLNFFSLAKGKTRIEVFRREIADISVRRAFAVISLSLVMIGASATLLVILEPDQPLISLVFESFSAYCTVGLSLNLTPELSNASKLVIVFNMFVGRIGMLTVMMGFIQNAKYKNYRYPTEEILIN